VPAPSIIWDESAAFDAVKALVVAALPEVDARDIYRGRPAATPGKYGPASVNIIPLVAAPEYMSPLGAESESTQQQRWTVTVTTAAAGAWGVTVLGEAGQYVAGGGDTTADIAAGLRAAVDGLGVAVTTQALANTSAFGILGDTAGDSLGVTVTPAAGGARTLAVVDDNLVRCVYNWGVWRVRLIFRCTPSSSSRAADPGVYDTSRYLERVRLWLQASSLPVTNGSAYPYRRDQMQNGTARLSWLSTNTPIVYDEVEGGAGGTWARVGAIDVAFQCPVGMVHDVPSLDAIGLASDVVID
jgi:hypothetical protein